MTTGRDRRTRRHPPRTGRPHPVDAICVEKNQAEIAALLGIAPEAVLDRLGLDGRIVSAAYTGSAPTAPDGTR